MPRLNDSSDRSDIRTSKRRRLNDNYDESPLEASRLAQEQHQHTDLLIAGEGEGQLHYETHSLVGENYVEDAAVNLADAAKLECCFGMVGSYVNGAVLPC